MTTIQPSSADPEKFWYDGFVKGDRFIPVAGPFRTREEADAIHHRAAVEADKMHPGLWFETWGVASYLSGEWRGKLNDLLGVVPYTPSQP